GLHGGPRGPRPRALRRRHERGARPAAGAARRARGHRPRRAGGTSTTSMTGERLDRARRVLDVEAHALTAVRDRLDARFTRALDLRVPVEACPLGLAPTASTTAAMALGDALALALLEERGFSAEDFALLHPGGALGRRLTRVEDLMHRGDAVPLVAEDTAFKETLVEITSKRLGVTGVLGAAGELCGVITDGDLRRALERTDDPRGLRARDLMTASPKTIAGTALAAEAVPS